LRKLAALEGPRGSFDDAVEAIERATGQRLGKRQVEELAGLAAVDFEGFYETRRPAQSEPGDLLVLSADGKGIVMRPDALRTATAKRAARARSKPKPRLSRCEHRNHKRMAEIGAVYDATPAPRTATDILPSTGPEDYQPTPGPVAKNKWLTASIVKDPAEVITRVFDEAERRDSKHRRTWVALVDGASHQIQRIKYEAKKRAIKVTIVCDYVHVLEYLWHAGGCLHPDGDPATIERWVHHQALPVLEGHARSVAGTIRRTATNQGLDPAGRKPADDAANYLTNLASPLPRLRDRSRERVADRDRDRRGRVQTFGEGPHGHHRRPLGPRRRRSDPQATRHQSQRGFRGLLGLPPQPRTTPRPRSPLPQPRGPERITGHLKGAAPLQQLGELGGCLSDVPRLARPSRSPPTGSHQRHARRSPGGGCGATCRGLRPRRRGARATG
jgi:hypothetical protein